MPIIIGISQYKGKTLQIDLDEGEPIFIHADIAYEYHLKKDMSLPLSAIDEVKKANDTRRAKERALYLLDERDYSYIELFKKLERNYPEDICYSVCTYLAQAGLINDRRYAEKLAEYYSKTKRFGYYRTREEMKKRGIAPWLIDETVEPYREDYSERISEVIDKKYRKYLFEEKGIDKVKSALVRLGYSYSEVNRAIKEYMENLDTEEE